MGLEEVASLILFLWFSRKEGRLGLLVVRGGERFFCNGGLCRYVRVENLDRASSVNSFLFGMDYWLLLLRVYIFDTV